MNRPSFSLTCAVLVIALAASLPGAAAAAAASDSGGLLGKCDTAVALAETATEQVGACVDGLVKAAASGVVFSTEATAARYQTVPAGKLPSDVEEQAKKDLLWTLQSYYEYKAFGARDPKQCEPLHFLVLDGECRRQVEMLKVQAAWYGPTSDLISLCEQFHNDDGRAWSRECCELDARVKDKPNPCASLVPRCVPEMQACRSFFDSMAGVADCKESRPTPLTTFGCHSAPECRKQYEDCLASAAFAKAARAKDVSRCGDSRLCRVLMGQSSQVVKEMEAELVKKDAGRWFVERQWEREQRRPVVGPTETAAPARRAPLRLPSSLAGFVCQAPIGTDQNSQVVNNIFGFANSCLTSVESVVPPGDVELVRQIDDREERLAKLRVRVRAYFQPSALAPRHAGAAPSGAPGTRKRPAKRQP